MRLLLIEDDDDTVRYLQRGLKESGWIVDVASNGALGLALALEGIFDVVIADRFLPDLDGIALVKRLRATDASLPILMLSAAGTVEERVAGLRAGCDDYMVKPFALSEVLARIDAMARRSTRDSPENGLAYADLTLDITSRSASRAGARIALQHREFHLLHCLVRHAERVVTRSMLIESAWDYAFDPRGNVIDMHIHRLRNKVDRDHDTPLIHTVAGAGYLLSKTAPG
jgi:two-component system OmpR family response regulator